MVLLTRGRRKVLPPVSKQRGRETRHLEPKIEILRESLIKKSPFNRVDTIKKSFNTVSVTKSLSKVSE